MEDLFRDKGIDLPSALDKLKKIAADLNLPWGTRTRTYNSRRAQELGKWAESLNKGEEFHLAMFQAYFVHGQNIADMAVLKEIAGAIGLDSGKAEQVLIERTFREAVDGDWDYARISSIVAVPTFMVRGRRLVGAQPYPALETLLRNAKGNGLTPLPTAC